MVGFPVMPDCFVISVLLSRAISLLSKFQLFGNDVTKLPRYRVPGRGSTELILIALLSPVQGTVNLAKGKVSQGELCMG